MHHHRNVRRAFSLIELVIVVVIIGIIAAIAIPRMSRGAEGATEGAMVGDLAVMRNAIDLYGAEHGGAYPALADLTTALTQYSDFAGDVQATKDATHIFGPYLRKFPALPVTGNHTQEAGVSAPAAVPPVAEVATAGTGWLYDVGTGQIWANHIDHFDK